MVCFPSNAQNNGFPSSMKLQKIKISKSFCSKFEYFTKGKMGFAALTRIFLEFIPAVINKNYFYQNITHFSATVKLRYNALGGISLKERYNRDRIISGIWIFQPFHRFFNKKNEKSPKRLTCLEWNISKSKRDFEMQSSKLNSLDLLLYFCI